MALRDDAHRNVVGCLLRHGHVIQRLSSNSVLLSLYSYLRTKAWAQKVCYGHKDMGRICGIMGKP